MAEILSMTVQVNGGTALIMHGPLSDPAHIEATLSYGLAFGRCAVCCEFTSKGANYRIAQSALDYDFPAIQRALWEAEDPALWNLRDGVLEGQDSAVMISGLMCLLDGSKAAPVG
jgi:hypothetical protein